jgi:LemA protein
MEVKIDEASSSIDVALEKRYSVLTKQMEIVKGVCSHEQKILFESIKLRQGMNFDEQNEAIEKVTRLANGIHALVENYPEIKTTENFMILQKSVNDTEEHLQAARRLFNSNVSSYNQYVVTFPNSIVASLIGKTQKTFFTADDDRKADVNLSMND